MNKLALAVLVLAWPLAGCDGLEPINLGATRAFIDEVGDDETLVFTLAPLATEGFIKQLATVQVPVVEADFVTIDLEYERPFTGKVFLAWNDGEGKQKPTTTVCASGPTRRHRP